MTNRTSYLKWLCGSLLLFTLSLRSACAFARHYAPDDELVQRSESIVIAHTTGPFELVKHPMLHNSFPTWEHQVTLVITEVLKGSAHPGEIRISIHYGIDPIVLKTNPSMDDLMHPVPAEQNHDSNATFAIHDPSYFTGGGMPDSADITKDQIWFLRTANPTAPYSYDGEENPKIPGIWTPQDLQPLDLKAYFQALLSSSPEAALNSFTVGDTPLAERARDAQRCVAVARISKIPDLAARTDQLLPYFSYISPTGEFADFNVRAYSQLIAAGTIGTAKLVPIFQNPKYQRWREGIMSAWSQTHYQGAVPVIIAWLKQEDQIWAAHDTRDISWADIGRDHSHDPDPNLLTSYDNMVAGVEFLKAFHAVEAKAVIEQIKGRWAGVDPPQREQHLTKACNDALASFQ